MRAASDPTIEEVRDDLYDDLRKIEELKREREMIELCVAGALHAEGPAYLSKYTQQGALLPPDRHTVASHTVHCVDSAANYHCREHMLGRSTG